MSSVNRILSITALTVILSLSNSIVFASDLVVFNDNGAWCWYQDERVIVHNNKLIMGSVADSSGTEGATRSGNIEVVTYDIGTAGPPQRFVLHANLQDDDHDLPAFLALPDNNILAIYSKHSSDGYARWRITTNPDDVTGWISEQTMYHSGGVCYSNVFQLSAESGRIYDFFRGGNNYGSGRNPQYFISDDNGQNWNYGGQLLRNDGNRPYLKYASNNVDKVHFIATDGHPASHEHNQCSIYHGYMYQGAVYKSDGTLIRNLADGPAMVNELTKVFPGDINNNAWTTDIHLDENGYPYIGYTVQIDDNPNDNRYRYARWDGTQWHDHEIAYAGTYLYASQYEYTGLIALDPQNPNRVYISTDADPYTGDPLISQADGNRHYEIFEGITEDFGATWTWQPITKDSTYDNLRPIVPVWDSEQTVLLWMRGKYTSYTNYDLDIVGMFDPEPIYVNPYTPVITDSPDDVLAFAGDTAEFTISAQSPLTLDYAWFKIAGNGQDIQVGANSNTLTLNNVQPEDQSLYYCIVFNSEASVTSRIASLALKKTVAHWPLDETYEDIRENGFDAVPNGNPVFVTGTIGSHAVDLDGDDYLDCGNDQLFDLKNSGTISTWIKTDRLSYSWASIAGKGRWTWRLCRNATANTAAFHIDTVNGAFAANGTLGIIDGQWHHVVGTYDDNSLSLYVDGQLDVSVPASGAITPTADPVWIGGRSDAERFWEGSIDDVRIFNYALTAATIEALYQGLNCTEVSKYDLNTDCIVNMLDLAIFMEEWLQCGLVPQSSCYYTTE